MPTVDIDLFLAPVPGDDPAGGPLPFDTREQLEALRKEDDPASYAADDPMRPKEFRKADWPALVKLAGKALREQSKDLMVAARLTEALTKQSGLAGLADGLVLLRRLMEECWDRLFPRLDPDDPSDIERWTKAFVWLDDPDRGARFPVTVRTVPLVVAGAESFSWADWRRGQDAKNAADKEAFEKAADAAPRAQAKQSADDAHAADAALTALTATLNAKMGAVAPSMAGLRQALAGVVSLADQLLARKGPESADAPPAEEPAPAAEEPAPTAPARRSTTRADIYRQLGQLARQLQDIEPHSPVPFLVQRAVELGSLPFPLLMRALVRDAGVLSEMNRELGIKEEPPAQ